MNKKIRVIGAGIDTLIIGFGVESWVDNVDFDILSDAKKEAGTEQFQTKGCSINWHGVNVEVAARGVRGYEWVLTNNDVMVRVARNPWGGEMMPEIYITFSQQYLWTAGAEMAYLAVVNWLSKWANLVSNKISRCDLCIDIEMPIPQINVQKHLVTRARNKAEHEPLGVEKWSTGKQVTSYRIGAGDLLARIYDKTLEITVKKKEWFVDLWAVAGWRGDGPITRFEFQMRREVLKQFEIDSYSDLIDKLADLWKYCTNYWLRICTPGADNHQKLWKNKPYWKLVQDSIYMFGQTKGVERIKVKNVQYQHLMQQLRGLAVSAAGLKATTKHEKLAINNVWQDIEDIMNSDEYLKDVNARKAKYSNIEPYKKTLLDAVMEMGGELV